MQVRGSEHMQQEAQNMTVAQRRKAGSAALAARLFLPLRAGAPMQRRQRQPDKS